MDSHIPSPNTAESGEVLEGRVLSDDEVSRMERKEKSEEQFNDIIKLQEEYSRQRMRYLSRFEYLGRKSNQSVFFKDI